MSDESDTKNRSEKIEQLPVERLVEMVNEKGRRLAEAERRLKKEMIHSRRAEQELLEIRDRFRYIFDNALVSFWEEDVSEVKAAIDNLKKKGIVDFRSYFNEHPEFVKKAVGTLKVKDVNQATLTLFGAKSKDELLNGLDRVFVPESLPAFREILIAIADGETYFESETINQTLQGKRLHILIKASIPSEKKKFKNMLVSIVDISERKQAEESLRESEQKFRSIVEYSHEGILIVDDKYCFVYVNDELCRLVGYSREELLGSDFRSLLPEDSVDFVVDRYTRRQKGETIPSRYSFNLVRKDGEKRLVEISSNMIADEPGMERTIAQLWDITERKRLEEQLLQAQKMEAIGTLAGGMAHDFNNLLMGILGNTSMMLLEYDPAHPHYERLKNIEKFTESGAELTRQLLAFARSGKYEVKPTDLGGLIERSSDLFGRTRKEVKIFRKLHRDLWPVEVDRGQLEQVMLNLYVNAWQAMPEGGELYLETENVLFEAESITPPGLRPGKFVKISVTDTGEGMDEKVKRRIFEPFFTTREMGRGTGLGLASVYGIISNHGGTIEVDSKKGVGTTFRIYLPVSSRKLKPEVRMKEQIQECLEAVLLVDDEQMILEVGREMLEKLGCRVMTASSGKKAVELYRQEQDRIGLVILDMIMPGESGAWTFAELKKFDPDIKVLLSSGYGVDDQASTLLNRGANGFIQKPFTMKELSFKIREILNSHAPPSF